MTGKNIGEPFKSLIREGEGGGGGGATLHSMISCYSLSIFMFSVFFHMIMYFREFESFPLNWPSESFLDF